VNNSTVGERLGKAAFFPDRPLTSWTFLRAVSPSTEELHASTELLSFGVVLAASIVAGIAAGSVSLR